MKINLIAISITAALPYLSLKVSYFSLITQNLIPSAAPQHTLIAKAAPAYPNHNIITS
jgi:hypothetical protein